MGEGLELRPRVLIVDHDETVRFTLSKLLEEVDVEIFEAADGEDGWVSLIRHEPQLVLAELRTPRVDGLQLLKRLRGERRSAPLVLLLTQRDAPHEARRAMEAGAYDQLAKPLEPLEMQVALRRALTHVRLHLHNDRLHAELGLARYMVFRSASMRAVARQLTRVAALDVSVLIRGRLGSGRRLAARALHDLSSRGARPLVSFDCASGAPSTIDRALFGHPCAATQPRLRQGVLRQAEGGTLLLREVTELDANAQAKLLAVLQSGELPLADGATEPIDVRVIATTHEVDRVVQRDATRRFRDDLLARLSVGELTLPPLSQRPEDIPPLAEHLVQQHAMSTDRPTPQLTSELRQALIARPWPGDVEELRQTLARALTHCPGEELTAQHLDHALGEAPRRDGLRERIERYERTLLEQALEQSGDNRSRAARALQIGRVTLLDKIKKYGL
ncbi:MAG: sigma-54-dependent Fis family transcriptional regulator [Proteobacteria bacterium]|nr:MAG: sigma-54-dependent Fis family transcriptional regulator [Pseudomonadota bacterium]PIE17348.1 MAG: sigma-54-dependent Fis family transcriptional regulator [Pseudomonadota bacterium]